jgi:hypothetical protein
MRSASLVVLLLAGPLMTAQSFAQTVLYKCPSCGQYHQRAASTAAQPATIVQPAAKPLSTATAQPAVTAAVATETKVPAANATQPASAVESTTTPAPAVQTASATQVVPSTTRVSPPRWRFHNATKWARRIDPNAQAWAQKEANLLASRGYQGYLRNGHPGGANPHATVTGTGTTFVGADLIHTCEGSNGMTLVAEAAAVSSDGRIYGVRSWR